MSQNNTSNTKILVVDDEETIRKLLTTRLTRDGYEVITAEDGAQGLESATANQPDVIITDIKMPSMDGFQMMDGLLEAGVHCPIVVITGHGDKECAVEAMHKGAFDYLEKPFDMDTIAYTVKRAVDRENLRRANVRLVEDLKDVNAKLETKLEVTTNLLEHTPVAPTSKSDLLGVSESMEQLKATIRTIAEAFRGDHDPVVLITGESGVGKEVVARYIHDQTFSLKNGGKRGAAPFVAVNCAAFPENLLESELFGYEKGAFTGAMNRKMGLFEIASGGTIFLDEIGEMDLRMQVKILRVLQERVVRRLGGTQDIKFNANIVAATNRDLAAGVANKVFREDLYYRLNTLPLLVPPLRSRPEDILPLAQHFLKQAGIIKKFKGISQSAGKALMAYRWPGNVRELKSVIDRAAILEKGPQMELTGFRQETMRAAGVTAMTGGGAASVTSLHPSGVSPASSGENATVHQLKRSGGGNTPGSGIVDVGALMVEGKTFADIRKDADEHFVREILSQYLARAEGNVSHVARLLKMDRANLLRMFRRYHIDPDLFRKKLEEAA